MLGFVRLLNVFSRIIVRIGLTSFVLRNPARFHIANRCVQNKHTIRKQIIIFILTLTFSNLYAQKDEQIINEILFDLFGFHQDTIFIENLKYTKLILNMTQFHLKKLRD